MREEWEDCDTWTQALMIAYEQVRQHEELEEHKALAGVGSKPPPMPKRPRGRRRRR